MAFADFDSPRHVLRSSSTSLLASPNPHTAPHSDDYSHSSAPYEDHLGDFIAESRFDEHFGSAVDTSAEFKGLGLDMDIDLGGSDDEDEKPRIGLTYAEGAFEGRGESGAPTRARTRLQSKLGKPHTLLLSGLAASPDLSRSPYRLASAANDDGPSSDSSPFFPGGLPSPFRQPSHPNSATMDPAHFVRSSSLSSTSTSASSSVYGGGGDGSSVLGASQSTTTSQSSAPSSKPDSSSSTTVSVSSSSSSQPRHKKSASSGSPKKQPAGSPKKRRGGGVRKLTDLDRKNICLHREANPTLKQDLIAERFNIERSTVSKILKDKAHWLAVGDDDDDIFSVPSPSPSFSAQSGPLLLDRATYGAYPTSSSQSQSTTSTPSTPVTGYFSHGNGSQSQLQAAFIDPSTALPPVQSSPTGVAARRATISGTLSFQSSGPILSSILSSRPLSATTFLPVLPARHLPLNPSSRPLPPPSSSSSSFDQALSSLQTVLEYLSQEGQAFIQGPRDLIVLSDIMGKMALHAAPPPLAAPPPFSPYQAGPPSTSSRLRLSRAPSSSPSRRMALEPERRG